MPIIMNLINGPREKGSTMQKIYRTSFRQLANEYLKNSEIFEFGYMDSWSGRVKFSQTGDKENILKRLMFVAKKINDKRYINEFIQENCSNLQDLYNRWKTINPKYDTGTGSVKIVPEASEHLGKIISVENLHYIAKGEYFYAKSFREF